MSSPQCFWGLKYSCTQIHSRTECLGMFHLQMEEERGSLMARLCSGSGERMFGWCQANILDLVLLSITEGIFREMITQHKRMVWEEMGTERTVAPCVGDLRLARRACEISHLFYLCLWFKCQRWIGRRRKVERTRQKRQRGIEQQIRQPYCFGLQSIFLRI